MSELRPEIAGHMENVMLNVSAPASLSAIEIERELHRLTAELEKVKAERDALRESIEGATRLKFYEAHAFGLALDDHSDIALVRIVPEQEGSS